MNIVKPLQSAHAFMAAIWLMIVTYMPGPVGYQLRCKFWGKKLKHMGTDVLIDVGVCFYNPEFISVDNNAWIDKYVIILAGPDTSQREKIVRPNADFKGEPGVVHIGKNVHIAPGCVISGKSAGVYISDNCGVAAGCKIYAFVNHYQSKQHPTDEHILFSNRTTHEHQCIIEGPIQIGCNVGIALHSIILPGVSIPDRCFVAINSVVKKGPFEEKSIIAGNPAKSIRKRFAVRTSNNS